MAAQGKCSFATFAAIRRASSLLSNLAAERRPGSSFEAAGSSSKLRSVKPKRNFVEASEAPPKACVLQCVCSCPTAQR
jgi:hypothetical protein